ncbi:MAG: hypothetical protein J6C11_07500 [Spirochaetaceae bacterium]|nr:hypothetical protein [Spirochaetaceae bacterium]
MRRFLAILALFLSLLPYLGALDLSGALHVDTYSGSPAVGFSFLAQENIAKGIAIRAQAEYLTAKAYDIQTLVLGKISRFTIGGGFALNIENKPDLSVAPGVSLLMGMQVTSKMSLELSSTFSLLSDNLSKLFGFKANAKIMYNNDNANAFLKYTIRGAEARGFIHRFYAETEAFEKGIPLALLLGTGLDLFMTDQRELDVNVMGGFSIHTGKYGKYFAKAKVGVLSQRENSSLPYDISVGASFSL